MPLEPYQQYQPSTPDATPSPRLGSYRHSRNVSACSTWSSPDSILSLASAATHLTTPNASPLKLTSHNILPKIRTQDQGFELDYRGPSAHRRAQSHDVNAQRVSLPYRPSYQRSTTSPPEFSAKATPLSETSTLSSWVDSAGGSPLAYPSYNGYESFGHGRSVSNSSIDPSCYRAVGNPYYRTAPVYVTQEAAQYAPPTMTYQDFGAVDPFLDELQQEYIFREGDDPNAVSTINTYLTEPNPTVYSVPENERGWGNGKCKHFWWDVRNIRPWDDFKFDTISNIPVIASLAECTIASAGLPTPAPLSYSASNPQDLTTLAHTIKDFHIAKVNNALKATTRNNHMTMSLMKTPQDGFYFVSNRANEVEGTLSSRGRVVGLVVPFERWNSGKRRELGQKRIEYLQHLSHLQCLMRQHNCRYGFIITEIELVCVRLGTKATPDFGYLELSRPIAMTTCRDNLETRADGMSVCLAIWYLNILAGDSFGQPHYRLEVGPPEAQTRAKVLAKGLEGRDTWIPRVQEGEKREAKRARGWIFPEDPVHRQKEGVGSATRARRR